MHGVEINTVCLSLCLSPTPVLVTADKSVSEPVYLLVGLPVKLRSRLSLLKGFDQDNNTIQFSE